MARMLHDDIVPTKKKKQFRGTDITGMRQVPNSYGTPEGPVNSYPPAPLTPATTRPVGDRPLNLPSSGGETAAYGFDTAAPPRYIESSPSSGGITHKSVAESVGQARKDIQSPGTPIDLQALQHLKGQVLPAEPWPHGKRFMEAGVPGTGIFSGFISSSTTGEFNPDMFGWSGMRIYEQMRRTDADVAAALFAMKLPMYSVTPEIIKGDSPNGNDGNLADEIAAFVRENIMGGLERENPNIPGTWATQSFDEVKENAFLMLDFGCAAHENLWRVDGGKLRLRYLAPRMPHTFYRWWTCEDGETLTGLEQLGYRRERYVSTTIPANDLCVFTNRKEGANFFGISVLRSAYIHFYIKQNLYRIDSMALEKNGMGVPFIKFPPGSKKEDIAAAQQWVEQMAVSERTGLTLPDGYEFEIAGLKGRLRDPGNSIKHHSEMICRSVMAMFISLGTTATGSRALGNTLLDMFRQSLQHYASVFCSQFTNSTIKPLVDMNFPMQKGKRPPYPQLAFPSIVVIDPVETANVLQKLGQSQVDIIHSSEPLEKAVLAKFGLPYGPSRTKFAPTVTQVRIMAQPAGEETVAQIGKSQAPIEEQKPLGGENNVPSPSKGKPQLVPKGNQPQQQPHQPDELHTHGDAMDVHDMVNTIVAGPHGTTAAREKEKEGKPSPRKYKLSDMREFQGIPIMVENDIGDTRSGVGEDGEEWSVNMTRPYGYIKGVLGLDQEELDCFIGPYNKAKNVYVIRTNNPRSGVTDEEKIFLGFRGQSEAKNAFMKNYTSPDFFRSIRTISLPQFKRWIELIHGGRLMDDNQRGGRIASPGEIGFDLDGSLAHDIKPFNPDIVGSPIPEALEKVKKLQEIGYGVWIFTARVDLRPVIRWSLDTGLNLPVTNQKRPQFIAIIDNRAISSGESVSETIAQVKSLTGEKQ